MVNMTTEERLEKLEREQAAVKRHARRLLIVFALTAGAFVLAWLLANSTRGENIIRARGFILEDDQGRTRGKLVTDERGPSLSLYDEKGQRRVGLDATKGGAGLYLYDENGKHRAELIALSIMSSLSLYDENGQRRVGLGVNSDVPDLGMEDMVALSLSDQKDKLRAVLRAMTGAYPESSVRLYGPDGDVTWSAPR